jgi:hypothetical protein
MHPQLRRKRSQLLELKDRWSQLPVRKVEDSAVASVEWAQVMVGYDKYELVRQQAAIRAARIWQQHELEGSIWPDFDPTPTLASNHKDQPVTILGVSYDDEGGDGALYDEGQGDSQLSLFEDLCEELEQLHSVE